jgi:hypothetical protein
MARSKMRASRRRTPKTISAAAAANFSQLSSDWRRWKRRSASKK